MSNNVFPIEFSEYKAKELANKHCWSEIEKELKYRIGTVELTHYAKLSAQNVLNIKVFASVQNDFCMWSGLIVEKLINNAFDSKIFEEIVYNHKLTLAHAEFQRRKAMKELEEVLKIMSELFPE